MAIIAALALPGLAAAGRAQAAGPDARPVTIVVLGDSLVAGYLLASEQAFPARLAQALTQQGEVVRVINAGVSGDTATAGLARVDWSVPEGTDAVILELGANDALRGVDPQITRTALAGIVARLKQRGIAILLAGMRAPRNLGAQYAAAFDAIYPELAAREGIPLYPFFLEGVVRVASLNLADGLHPNAAGVDAIVARILPDVTTFIARVRAARGA